MTFVCLTAPEKQPEKNNVLVKLGVNLFVVKAVKGIVEREQSHRYQWITGTHQEIIHGNQ